ncbi:phytoene/squalene synthase family protein [Amphritea sp. HPY]|uniref:phytoene/squalene synthase family protein n=1 Tax=Amphritea sp. HPY TaxID=3421652 RepID=UPI003D7E439F
MNYVSRSFALTIPQLPGELETPIANAYLWCRVVDTVEDDPGISLDSKKAFFIRINDVLHGRACSGEVATEITPVLSDSTPAAERELIEKLALIDAVYKSLPVSQQRCIQSCVDTMTQGMLDFCDNSGAGLDTMADLQRYCYCVAGVVGELLTELFCDFSPDIEEHRPLLEKYSVAFGEGLQLTNIIKDVWVDQQRDCCWLPRDIFSSGGYDLQQLAPDYKAQEFKTCIDRLISEAMARLNEALTYTLLIPPEHKGIRVFCLWAVGMAVATLAKIQRSPEYYQGQQVKISRRYAVFIMKSTSLAAGNDYLIKMLIKGFSRGVSDTKRS